MYWWQTVRSMMKIETPEKQSKIAVLMATYNGGEFLRQQLESLKNQTEQDQTLYVSDDGSTDDTIDILEEFARSHGIPVFIMNGPQAGFSENFRYLIGQAGQGHEFYAFCDQDDVWHHDHLERGISAVDSTNDDRPRLSCGRSLYIDERGEKVGYSPIFRRQPSFRNALVQSIAGGNTMVMDARAFQVLRDSSEKGPFASHDWWAYMIVTAVGGTVSYRREPTISYRQHTTNLVGASAGFKNWFNRMRLGFSGRYRDWNAKNIDLMSKNIGLMLHENRKTFKYFCKSRDSYFPNRLYYLFVSGVYRQTFVGNLVLQLACLLKKI